MNLESLSPARRQLVRTLQRIQFGEVEGLHVKNGDPVWMPGSRIVRNILLGKDPEPQECESQPNFELKRHLVDLFKLFDSSRTLVVERLEIQHGLPFRILITEAQEISTVQ